jgi:tellurite resistance protein TehA-like permease
MSTLHYAHAAVSFIFGGMALAAAALMEQGSGEIQQRAGILVAVAGLGLWAYSLVRVALGRRAQVREQERFEVLKALRRELNLEDPSALLPR